MSTKTVTHAEAQKLIGKIGDCTIRYLEIEALARYSHEQEAAESRNSPEAIAKRIVEAARLCGTSSDRCEAFDILAAIARGDVLNAKSPAERATRILADVIRGG